MKAITHLLFVTLAMSGTSGAFERKGSIDAFRQPIEHYYNDCGGNRGLLYSGNYDTTYTGGLRATSTGGSVGIYEGIGGNLQTKREMMLSAVYPPLIKATFQPRMTQIRLPVILVSASSSNVVTHRIEARGWNNGSEVLRASFQMRHSEVVANGGMLVWNLPSTLTSGVGLITVQSIGLVYGDQVTFGPIEAIYNDPVDPATTAGRFLTNYGKLLNQTDLTTGLVNEFAHYRSRDFESIPSSGKLAALTAMAIRVGYVDETAGRALIAKITDTLLNAVPDGPANLMPHWTKQGGTQVETDADWSSVDTSIALTELLKAHQLMGNSTEVQRVLTRIRAIDWASLRNASGYYSHGYKGQSPSAYDWRHWGAETAVVLLTAHIGGGPRGNMDPPPPFGPGFIPHASLLLRGQGVDRFGTDWGTLRHQEVQVQINWFATGDYANLWMFEAGLFGLSSGDAVSGTYQPFGTEATSVRSDRVCLPHYAAMVASFAPVESGRMWNELETRDLHSPLNIVESMEVHPSTGVTRVNPRVSAWNLSLAAEGWALAMPGMEDEVKALVLADADLADAWAEIFPGEVAQRLHVIEFPAGTAPLVSAIQGDKVVVVSTIRDAPRIWVSTLSDGVPGTPQELTFDLAPLRPAYYINAGTHINAVAATPDGRFFVSSSGGIAEVNPDPLANNALTMTWSWRWDYAYDLKFNATSGKLTWAVANFGSASGAWEGPLAGPFGRPSQSFFDVRGLVGSSPSLLMSSASYTLPPATDALPYTLARTVDSAITNVAGGLHVGATILAAHGYQSKVYVRRDPAPFNALEFPDVVSRTGSGFDDTSGRMSVAAASTPKVFVSQIPTLTVSPATLAGGGVTFQGIIGVLDDAARIAFEYRTAGTTLLSTTGFVDFVASAAAQPCSAIVMDLPPAVTMEFRVLAITRAGTLRSTWSSVVVPVQPPVLESVTLNTPFATGVVISARVRPKGVAASVLVEYGTTTTYGSTTPSTNLGASNAAVDVDLHVTGLAPAMTYHARVVLTSTGGTTTGEELMFTTPAEPPVIVTQPSAQTLVFTGQPVLLSVTASGTGLTYAWNRNGIPINETSGTLDIPAAALSDGGTYTVEITNAAGVTVTSDPAQVVIVAPGAGGTVTLQRWSSYSFGVDAGGPVSGYQWLKNGSPISTAIQPAYMIGDLQPSDAGSYSCRVRLGTASLTTTAQAIVIADPVLDFILPAYSWQVGRNVSEQLTATHPIASWTVTGLPAGLTVSRYTGVVSGRATLARSYTLSVRATSITGAVKTKTTIAVVGALPAPLLGQFTAIVPRHGSILPLGGRLDLTVSAAAAITGKLTHDGRLFSFTTPLIVAADGSGNFMATIARPVPLSSFICQGTLATPEHTGSLAPFYAQDSKLALAFVKRASQTSGRHIFALPPEPVVVGDMAFPQGTGIVAADVTAAGAATTVIWLSDGTSVTVSTIVGAQGDTPVQASLYAGSGSVSGTLRLQSVATDFEWSKNAQPAASITRSYKSGFALHRLQPIGGPWIRPSTGQFLLGVTADIAGNARVTFEQNAMTPLIQSFRLTSTNVAVMPAAGTANPRAVTLALSPVTGLFTGAFSSVLPTVQRVAYRGAIIPGQNRAMGHFQLGVPSATGALHSGKVTLDKTP